MSALVECVPNFSEGRDPAKIDAIAAAIDAVVPVLDVSRDPDHNRCVITFAGAPDAIVEAAVRAAGEAARVIDLRVHAGVHPRIGALDVLPFVPLREIGLPECARLASIAAELIWQREHIPAYLYASAARLAERENLAVLRRPNPGPPDIGGPELHPTAGAIAVGARPFLIAYNVNLQSSDFEAAAAIARAVRASNGGLPGVKALGLWLESRGLAQVSMNLTDFHATPIHVAFQAVSAEAARRGIEVLESELVGLVPREAWNLSTPYDLQWTPDATGKILEDRLAMLR